MEPLVALFYFGLAGLALRRARALPSTVRLITLVDWGMFGERISIHNFLRAGEIFLQEHGNYSHAEQTLMRTMLRRLSVKMDNAKDTEDPPLNVSTRGSVR